MFKKIAVVIVIAVLAVTGLSFKNQAYATTNSCNGADPCTVSQTWMLSNNQNSIWILGHFYWDSNTVNNEGSQCTGGGPNIQSTNHGFIYDDGNHHSGHYWCTLHLNNGTSYTKNLYVYSGGYWSY